MNCPVCQQKMECEQCPEVRPTSLSEYDRTGKTEKLIPAAIYRCVECDAEYSWIRSFNGPSLHLIDSAEGGREHLGV